MSRAHRLQATNQSLRFELPGLWGADAHRQGYPVKNSVGAGYTGVSNSLHLSLSRFEFRTRAKLWPLDSRAVTKVPDVAKHTWLVAMSIADQLFVSAMALRAIERHSVRIMLRTSHDAHRNHHEVTDDDPPFTGAHQ